MKKKRLSRNTHGFTFVELLVVTAILCILGALLLPLLQNAVGTGRLTACASNLRSAGIALNSYATDFSGYYPIWFNPNNMVGPATCFTAAGGGNPMADGFTLMAKEYAGVSGFTMGTTAFKPEANGIFTCPAKSIVGPVMNFWDVSYMTAQILQMVFGFGGYGYPAVPAALMAEAEAVYKPTSQYAGILVRRTKCPGIWPVFYDSANLYVGSYPKCNSNHIFPWGLTRLNALYMDGAVIAQNADIRFLCSYRQATNEVLLGNSPKWYLPYVRTLPFPQR